MLFISPIVSTHPIACFSFSKPGGVTDPSDTFRPVAPHKLIEIVPVVVNGILVIVFNQELGRGLEVSGSRQFVT